jgi:alanine racemase
MSSVDKHPDENALNPSSAAARRWARTWVEIDPDALRRNWRRIVAHLPAGGFAIACVKKDGYGHGLLNVARALAGEENLWGLGVATIEEAVALRECGMRNAECGIDKTTHILVMVPLEGEALDEAIRLKTTLTITDLNEARAADRAAAGLGLTASAHFKFDTGMGRLGRLPDEVAAEFVEIARLPNLRVEAVYTHLADAWHDETSRARQRAAMARFREAAGDAAKTLPVHWGGSDAMVFLRDLPPGDGLRAGIALYGDHPAADFEPAMTFKTRIVYRRRVPPGTPISYGSEFTTTRETELAVIGAGYGNGVLRALGNKADILIDGQRCPIRGRVCMDQVIVDVTDPLAAGASIQVGDEAVIFGRQTTPDGATTILPAAEQARHAGTISYELFCLAGQMNPHR